MLSIRSAAPAFDCLAILHRQPVRLTWGDLHSGRWLALLFEPLTWAANRAEAGAELRVFHAPFAEWGVGLALVWEARPETIQTTLAHERAAGDPGKAGIGDLPIPLIADADHFIARAYQMRADEDCPLWGHFVIDPDGIIRQMGVTALPIVSNLRDILRFIESYIDPS